ncbi:pre-60S ribosomal particles component [Entomophthora muscae]|uniref:Pre-60S ribosomal particles component n=1 Tax=Entomophthora muscae TaxID=34485 RepID=A0ACC2SGC7_9FUNG|nr:pre-60S ribosomal particles component [Entomophthora muscae]
MRNNKGKDRKESKTKGDPKRKENPNLEPVGKKVKGDTKARPKGKINLKAGNYNKNPVGKTTTDHNETESSSEESESDFSSEEEEEEEGNNETEERQPKKKKKSVKHGSDQFAATLAHLISQEPGSLGSQAPVLSKARDAATKIEEGRLDYKARKIVAAEKKKILEKDRIKCSPLTLDYEKKLRSIATRGVIMIFNAMQTQHRVADLDTLARPSEKAEVAKMSKASFLSMLKSGSAAGK